MEEGGANRCEPHIWEGLAAHLHGQGFQGGQLSPNARGITRGETNGLEIDRKRTPHVGAKTAPTARDGTLGGAVPTFEAEFSPKRGCFPQIRVRYPQAASATMIS